MPEIFDEFVQAQLDYEAAQLAQQEAIGIAVAAAEEAVRKVCDETQVAVDVAMQKLLTLKRVSQITVN